jgi:hypothetical protein
VAGASLVSAVKLPLGLGRSRMSFKIESPISFCERRCQGGRNFGSGLCEPSNGMSAGRFSAGNLLARVASEARKTQ